MLAALVTQILDALDRGFDVGVRVAHGRGWGPGVFTWDWRARDLSGEHLRDWRWSRGEGPPAPREARGVSDARGLKVIARFRDGRLFKGVSLNFRRDAAYFHIEEPDRPYGEGTRVDLKDLKAVFFVKSLDGKVGYKARSGFAPDEAPLALLAAPPGNGRPVRVLFLDGEEMVAVLRQAIDPKQRGFFLYPADAGSNNEHVFALREAVSRVEYLDAGPAGVPPGYRGGGPALAATA